MTLLYIALLIIGMVILIIYVRLLFMNYLASRFICAALATISIIVSLTVFNVWVLVPITSSAWCFFIGPVIFGTRYKSEDDASNESFDITVNLRDKKMLFLIINAVGSFLILGLIYIALATLEPIVSVIIPAILLAVDIVLIMRTFRR